MSGDINKEEEEEEEEEEENNDNNDDSEKNEASLAAAELLRLALLANRRDALKTRTTSLVFPEPGKVHALTRGGEEFREILYRKKKEKQCYSLIVLVYSMENCQPCRVFAPKIEHMARECGERLSVAFVKCLVNESDANRRLASEAGVAGFPRAQIFDGATGRKAISEDIKGANDVKLREVLEEKAYNVEKFDRLKDAAFAALSEAKAKLVANEVANEDERERRFATLVKTVIAYASNAIEKEDAKYKRINVNGKAFTERVKSCGEEGEKCLRAFGFEKKKIKEEESGDESEEAYYEISPLVFDEFHENNPFTKREMRRVIDMLRALTG